MLMSISSFIKYKHWLLALCLYLLNCLFTCQRYVPPKPPPVYGKSNKRDLYNCLKQDTYHERFIALKFFFTHRVEKYLFPSPIPAIILHHQRWKNRTFVYNNYIQTPNIIHGSIYMHIVFQNINVS